MTEDIKLVFQRNESPRNRKKLPAQVVIYKFLKIHYFLRETTNWSFSIILVIPLLMQVKNESHACVIKMCNENKSSIEEDYKYYKLTGNS